MFVRLPAVCAALLAVTLCWNTTCCGQETADLPEMCRQAKENFRPLSETDLQQAKQQLLEAVDRLDQRLAEDGPNGAAWRKYLKCESLVTQLDSEGAADLSELNAIYKRFASSHEGLGLVWFIEVRHALRQYLAVARSIGNAQLEAGYQGLMDTLADRLQAYAEAPSAKEALVIADAVRWLQDARQAPELLEAISQHLTHPNLFLKVSGKVIDAGIGEPVDDTAPIRDVILKTNIYGTGHTVGQTHVELFPDTRRGVIDTVLLGTTRSKQIGYHGPVRIYSRGTTRIGARKRLWIDAMGLHSFPAVSNAVTDTTITAIRAKRSGGLIEKFAWKQVGKQKAEGERIAGRHAERRVNQRVDEQAAEMLARVNEAFIGKFRRPLLQRKLFPQQLQFSTTKEALQVVALQAATDQLAAPSTPPALAPEADLTLQVHESMINNLAAGALGGLLLKEESLQATVTDLLGELPERMQTPEDEPPWAITFARRLPISVHFADDAFTVTIRGRRFYKGEDRHPGMNITVTYKIVEAEQGFKAIRQGGVEVLPPGFDPNGDKKLSTSQVIIRKLLQRRFEDLFQEELIGQGLELPGRWAQAGKMMPVTLVCRDGWLSVAWKSTPDQSDTAKAR